MGVQLILSHVFGIMNVSVAPLLKSALHPTVSHYPLKWNTPFSPRRPVGWGCIYVNSVDRPYRDRPVFWYH